MWRAHPDNRSDQTWTDLLETMELALPLAAGPALPWTLAMALIEGGRVGWGDPWVIAAFGAAAILTVLFLIQESRAKEPMLPLSLFANRVFARTTLIGLLLNIPFYGLIFVFSLGTLTLAGKRVHPYASLKAEQPPRRCASTSLQGRFGR